MTLKAKVAYILELYPETRSDDIQLCSMVWEEFYPECIFFESRTNKLVYMKDLYKLPSYDNISRYRRMFSPILPPTPEVAKHRNRKQKERRQEFGVSLADSVKDVL